MSSHTGNPVKKYKSLAAMKQKATILIQQQRFADASAALEVVCKKFPADAESWFMLGAVYGQLENFPQAERCCKKALVSAPKHPGLHHNLAIALLRQDKLDEAVEHLQTTVEIHPQFADAYHELGNALQARREYPAAVSAYHKAIELQSNNAAMHFNLGNALRDQAQLGEAIASYEAAVRLKPDFSDAYSELTALLIVEFKFPQAIKVLKKAVEILPDAYDLHFKLGATYQKMGDIDQSIPCFQRTLDLKPEHEDARSGIAIALGLKGEYQEAYDILRPLLDSDDYHGVTLVTFGHFAHRFGCEDEAITRLEKYLAKDALTRETKASLLFSLAKLKERKNLFDDAFDTYQQANKAADIAFNRAEYTNALNSLCTTYSETTFPTLPQSELQTNTPVFIVGMPRSGTSLVEQILASHPKVFGAGELNFIITAIAELPHRFKLQASYPECVKELDTDQLGEVAREYMDEINTRADGQPIVIDKMPNNFIHLGFINLLFPNARIIYCTRDPMDNCLSCYFQNFSGSHPYAYDLEDLAYYYREQQRIMDHWKAVIQLPILEVKYEELVQDQEAMTRRLVEFCGLDWDERCLDFHKADRTVATASNEQVRTPIYTSSIARWKTYEKHLGPLRSALDSTSLPKS